MKKIGIIAFVFTLSIIGVMLYVNKGETKIQSYYSGDAVYYNNQLIITSANSGSLEVFIEKDNKIERVARIKPGVNSHGEKINFSDLVLSQENGRLYVYLVSAYSIYKYDISTPNVPQLAKVIRNTYWEWYTGIRKNGDNIVVISGKKVNIFNYNLQNINSYQLSAPNQYNISIGNQGLFIAVNNDNHIEVYNRNNRFIEKSWVVNYKDEHVNTNHRIYLNTIRNRVFVIDDYFVKLYDLGGNLKASFRHLDQPGYDVVPSVDGNYVYVSNGIGIMKLDNNLKLNTYKFTSSLVSPNGWAMGMKAVWTPQGEKVVVFNNANILVLDTNLNHYTYFISTDQSEDKITESLFLNLDKISGAVGEKIQLNGGGFMGNENLKIYFDNNLIKEVRANNLGRFTTDLTIPATSPKRVDIKVVGSVSQQHYSISFEVK